jgi:hypothetical protein
VSSKTEANLAKLSEFEHRIADGEEDAFYAFDEWLADLPEDEVAALRLDAYDKPVKTPDGAWVERCWHNGCLSALIAPPAPLPNGFDPGRLSAAQAAAEATGWIYAASGRMFCPAHLGDWDVANSQEKDERCRDGCLALRMARVADQLLQEESPDTWWEVQFWALSSPRGEIKLTPAGSYPHGTVPVEFQIKWWLAVSDAAHEMVRNIRQGIT